eukprot:Tamp_33340.p2 GENE.Tamp_33340~~Tamp_33340.p2  ORF type:complete len:100 (+),score=1.81 Tamp_33340:292-591(+)
MPPEGQGHDRSASQPGCFRTSHLDLDAECVRVLAASNSAEERAENRLEQREGANAEALANAARTDAAHPRGFMKGDAARIADPPDPPRRCSRRRTSRRA